nr:hypothetical protein [Tanacetum cinerariifolium]
MGDEHLNTILAMESDELIKSCVQNLVPNPSEFKGENGCDVPVCFTTFSNVLFDVEYESDSRIDDTDCHPENEIRLTKRLLYDNSSPCPPEEFVFENSNADIESFSPSPILVKDSNSYMKEIDLSFNSDDPVPPGIDDDDDDSKEDNIFLERLLYDDPIPLLDTLDFSYEVRVFLPFFTYPVTSSILLSSRSEDTIFDPGIHYFSSLEPGVSHRSENFMKSNESPMEMLFSTCSSMD